MSITIPTITSLPVFAGLPWTYPTLAATAERSKPPEEGCWAKQWQIHRQFTGQFSLGYRETNSSEFISSDPPPMLLASDLTFEEAQAAADSDNTDSDPLDWQLETQAAYAVISLDTNRFSSAAHIWEIHTNPANPEAGCHVTYQRLCENGTLDYDYEYAHGRTLAAAQQSALEHAKELYREKPFPVAALQHL